MLIVALWLIVFTPCVNGYSEGLGPVITEPTTEPTLMPTVIEPTTESTPITTVPTPTTEPTFMPTVTEPTTVATTVVTTTPTSPIGVDQGWIDVHCNVDGSTVYFDGAYEGTTAGGILSVPVYTTGTPISTITVSQPGYTTWTGPLAAMPSNGQHVSVYATLNPLTTIPTTIPPVTAGSIYAQSSPAGAAIYMNGNFYGYSPQTITGLAPGTYSMKAVLFGYTPDNTLVYVYSGQTAPYYPVLQQSPQPRQTGSVYVTSNPTPAGVYVDGNYFGTTPLTITLYPGSHQVVLKLQGYNDYSTNIWVVAGQSQNLPVTMSSSTFGTVIVTSVPGAMVYMDSNVAGMINSAGTLPLNGVSVGNHIFKVTASGYNSWLNTVYIQPNTVNTISAALTPIGVPTTAVPAAGGLTIASTPTNAETYVDGVYRGTTPLTVTGLSPGDHLVRLSAPGYIDYSTTTSVTSGQTSPLAIALTVAPTPTATQSPAPGFVSILGVLVAAVVICGYMRRRS